MALHSPKTCVYFGSSRSLFSLFLTKYDNLCGFFFGNDELPSQSLTEKVTSTTLFSLLNPSSRSHLLEIKGSLQCPSNNWKLCMFQIWKNLCGLASIVFFVLWGMERLTDTCVVTEFGRDGLDSHNCSHFCPNTPNSSWQKFALLANPVSNDKLSLYLMQKNGKTNIKSECYKISSTPKFDLF